jgi:hypothetical protein
MKICYMNITTAFISLFCSGIAAQSTKQADNLFKMGEFNIAREVYAEIAANHPENVNSLIHLAYISLLSNRLKESEKWLNQVRKCKPKLPVLNYFMAENYYRQNRFTEAAPFYRKSGRGAMAKKMESVAGTEPYKKPVDFDEIRVKFMITDPLPVVEVIINTVHQVYFIIDTGAGELILENRFAREAGAELFGIEKNSEFGGGKKAPMGHGKITSITLAGHVIENVPINTLALNGLELGGYKIDGIMGTVFLYQFLPTIDYKNGQLILRNKAKYRFSDVLLQSTSPKIVPFTMADDHYIMAKGTVNHSGPMVFFIDTGLAGNAFTCPESSLKKADLSYRKNMGSKALGGGGHFAVYPMEIESLCLDSICRINLHGVYGAFPKQVENSFGFSVNGLLSHEFFRNYSLTIDFAEMKFILSE